MSSKGQAKQVGPPTIHNKRARYDYEILSTYEAGMVLEGSEVKSILRGQVVMTGSFCRLEAGELFLHELDIAPYEQATSYRPERRRKIKLLLHKSEIGLIKRRAEERGLAIIPLKIYFKNRRAKVEIAIGKGKKAYDKRESIAKKDLERERQRRDD